MITTALNDLKLAQVRFNDSNVIFYNYVYDTLNVKCLLINDRLPRRLLTASASASAIFYVALVKYKLKIDKLVRISK